MQWSCWTFVLVLTGCQSSLLYYGDKGGGGAAADDAASDDSEPEDEPIVDTSTPGTTDTTPSDGSDADTDADADSDADTDTDTDADTDADTDSDTDADTGVAQVPLVDGVYTGTIDIHYHLKFPSSNSDCDGPVTLIVDQTAATHITGALDCDWPLLDIWALIAMGHVTGDIDGMVAGFAANGGTRGDDTEGLFSWNETWNGTASGTTITGSFSYGGPFTLDEYDGNWTLNWVSP